jgi:hypothetical protein
MEIKVVIYSGSIKEPYGLLQLIRAFRFDSMELLGFRTSIDRPYISS